MGKRQKVWFEATGGLFDPGLVDQLWKRRKEDPDGRDTSGIPVLIHLKKDAAVEQKDKLFGLCNKDADNWIDSELEIVNTLHAHLNPEMIRAIKDEAVVNRIYYDREVHAFLDVSSRQIGAVDVHKQKGLTGKGVGIAILDTGIYPHQDLTKPEDRIVAFKDLVNNRAEPYDDQGHGTHCAGDAAGNGFRSDGLYIGPAPESSLVGVKVLDAEGGGRLSTIIRGIEWCMKRKDELGIRIISLSLGAPAFESYRDDPLSQAVQEAWHAGIVVCAAAGNSGPYPVTVGTPGINPFILTVGSMEDENTLPRADDHVARYSSRGPTIDWLVKPDIYAPGTDIASLNAPGSALEKQLPEQLVDEFYIRLSGTSMATPICAGVAALMLEGNPSLSPNDVKSILMATAQPSTGDQWGYIDANRAVEMARSYPQYEKQLKA